MDMQSAAINSVTRNAAELLVLLIQMHTAIDR
jgi:hypothetical protein